MDLLFWVSGWFGLMAYTKWPWAGFAVGVGGFLLLKVMRLLAKNRMVSICKDSIAEIGRLRAIEVAARQLRNFLVSQAPGPDARPSEILNDAAFEFHLDRLTEALTPNATESADPDTSPGGHDDLRPPQGR